MTNATMTLASASLTDLWRTKMTGYSRPDVVRDGGLDCRLGGSVPAHAQDSRARPKRAVRSNCRSDYMSKCSSVTPGGIEAFQCLKKNEASLSGGCRAAVTAIKLPGETPAAQRLRQPLRTEPAPRRLRRLRNPLRRKRPCRSRPSLWRRSRRKPSLRQRRSRRLRQRLPLPPRSRRRRRPPRRHPSQNP